MKIHKSEETIPRLITKAPDNINNMKNPCSSSRMTKCTKSEQAAASFD